MKKFALCVNADSETAKREADSAVKLLEGLGAEVVLETDGGDLGLTVSYLLGVTARSFAPQNLRLSLAFPFWA